MKAGTPLLQLQCLAGEDCLQLVGAGEQQPAVRRLIQQFPNRFQALNRQMLGFVKDQQHLTLAEIKTQVAQNPVDRAHSDCPTALRNPLHQVQRADSLTNVNVVSSPALSVLGDLRAVQLCDQMLQDIGLLGSWGAVEVIGSPMIQRLVEVLAQQTGILGFVELARADYWRRNWVGRDEAANRCPDGAVVGGDPAVIAIQKGVDRLPGVVDAAGKIRRCHAGPGQVILQLQPNFDGFRQAGRQQLPAYRAGKSHDYSPSVSSRTMSLMKSGRAAVCRSCGRIRVGGGDDCLSLGISARSPFWRCEISLRSPARARMPDKPVT